MIGTSVDRYEIVEELGHGGMSVVYRGLDSALEREVAVKVLHNHLAKKAENRQRFHREAKAIARLRHPNILEIYDFSSENADRSYIVMEYVEGENLRQFITRTEHPPAEVAALVCLEICEALEHAHDHGIIHRDLKPENVMVSSDGTLKLMDFGIAHVIDAETMTATGSLMGSPAHMAPEIIDGKKADVRADVFALGTVLYWLATGKLPFEGANAPQVLRKVLECDFPDPEEVDARVGHVLGGVIRRCLARDPADRYESVAAVRRALTDFVAPMGWTDYELELKKYIKNPDQYRADYADRIVARLTELARAAQRRRDVPAAIGHFNRILAYDPENREVQRLLDSLCRQASLRRTLPWIAVALIAAVGVGAYATTARKVEPVTPPSPAPVVVSEDPVTVPPEEVSASISESEERATQAFTASEAAAVASTVVQSAELATEALNEHHARHAMQPVVQTIKAQHLPAVVVQPAPEPDPRDETQDPKAPLKYRYKFALAPPAATFAIDGRTVDVWAASSGVELTEGPHVLTATSPGARRWRREIVVEGPQPPGAPMRVVLDWEDGRVRVVSNTRAVVWIGGSDRPHPIGKSGRNATLTFPFGPADSTPSEKRINLRIASAQDLGEPQEQEVTVKPGQTTTVQVNFDL